MTIINLRKYYPELYHSDFEISVPDNVAEALYKMKLSENAAYLRKYRAKAFYSLDQGDQIERDALHKVKSAYEVMEQKYTLQKLYAAMASLPDKQAKRVYAKYFFDMSVSEIARAEGVSEQNIRKSIKRGLERMKKFLDFFI